MKIPFSTVFSTLALLLTVPAPAAEQKAAARDEAPAPKDYPLTVCVVSDEKLGEMGKPIAYSYQEAGKPDRVVMLCCEHCIADLKGDPAKYLKKLDEAAAAKGKEAAGPKSDSTGKKKESSEHKH